MAISHPSPRGTPHPPGLPRRLLRAARRCASPRRLAATAAFGAALVRDIRRRRRDPRLTVAVDIDSLYETLTGVGWYLYQILAHLADRDDVALRLYGQRLTPIAARAPVVPLPAGPAIEHVTYQAPDGLVVPPWRANQLLGRAAPLLVAADRNRVLFGPNYLLPPLFRFAAGARVVTVHDLVVRRLPGAVRPDTARALAASLDRTLFDADLLLTPSDAVAQELIAEGVAPARVRPIHHGPGNLTPMAPAAPAAAPALDPDATTNLQWDAAKLKAMAATSATGAAAPAAEPPTPPSPPPGTPPSYGLFVGTLEPRKNLGTLLAAWRQLRQQGATPPLVVCGPQGWRAAALCRALAQAQSEGWLWYLGYVTPQELAALYRGAVVVALPSLYEGFGLPALEAMAAGAPLVLSDLPVFHEVADDAALYAPPMRTDLWRERLRQVLDDADLRADLARRARLRAARFDWRQAAAATRDAWRDAAARD
jgi:glycosyltransferase involved in cell wall biosynthesis